MPLTLGPAAKSIKHFRTAFQTTTGGLQRIGDKCRSEASGILSAGSCPTETCQELLQKADGINGAAHQSTALSGNVEMLPCAFKLAELRPFLDYQFTRVGATEAYEYGVQF